MDPNLSQVIRVWMSYPMWTDTLHHPTVDTPVLHPVLHVMVTGVMNTTRAPRAVRLLVGHNGLVFIHPVRLHQFAPLSDLLVKSDSSDNISVFYEFNTPLMHHLLLREEVLI